MDQEAVQRELSRRDVTSASAQQLRLTHIEREKFRFLLDSIPGIVFSYNRDSDIFSISPLGARQLGLREVISAPAGNKDFCEVFGADFPASLMADADKTLPETPEFTLSGSPLPRSPSISCKAIWLEGESRCCGVIGRIESPSHT